VLPIFAAGGRTEYEILRKSEELFFRRFPAISLASSALSSPIFNCGGGEAVIFCGHARLTGDIDIFFERSEENAARLFTALDDSWSGDTSGKPQSYCRRALFFNLGFRRIE
jgi:hypothetical protein